MTPFDVLDLDIDKFILMCNYLVSLSAEKPKKKQDDRQEAADFWAAL